MPMDRRSTLPGRAHGQSPNSQTPATTPTPPSSSSSSSSRRHGVLRQFRPAISDQWLSHDPNRRTTLVPSSSSSHHRRGTNAPASGSSSTTSPALISASMLASSARLTCPECLVVVEGTQALESHLQRRHPDSSGGGGIGGGGPFLNCPHCNETIKHRTNLHRHIRVKHDERTGRNHCRKCGFSCSSEVDLEKHKQRHRTCPFCRVIMESGTGLAKHMLNCKQRTSPRR